MKKSSSLAVLAAVVCFSASVASAAITIPTVTIGNPGNAADPATNRGSVAYAYKIATTEVTIAQYAAFLNAKAASDPFGLFNTNMSGSLGGIGNTTPVGSFAANFNGTFDMAGNVWEWNEQRAFGSFRGQRGGAFNQNDAQVESGRPVFKSPTSEGSDVGFRVVQVPEPSSVALLAISGVGALGRRRAVGQ